MSNTEFYLAIGAALVVGIVIAWGIITWLERGKCDRTNGNYNCRGENCEGCYRIIGGQVVYDNPQPRNDWGNRPLTVWHGK